MIGFTELMSNQMHILHSFLALIWVFICIKSMKLRRNFDLDYLWDLSCIVIGKQPHLQDLGLTKLKDCPSQEAL